MPYMTHDGTHSWAPQSPFAEDPIAHNPELYKMPITRSSIYERSSLLMFQYHISIIVMFLMPLSFHIALTNGRHDMLRASSNFKQ
jgi:hypothetical protein